MADSMSDLISQIAVQAERTGLEAKSEFKSKGAARAYLDELTAKPNAGEAPFDNGTEESGKPVLVPAGDNSKYSTVGKRGPNQGVGAFAKDLIRAGHNNAEVLQAVAEQFPNAKTSKACIAYYRAKVKAETAAPEVETAPTDAPIEEPAVI